MGQRVIQVDAFTSEAFRGNPAAVCVLATAAEDEWMQLVAQSPLLSARRARGRPPTAARKGGSRAVRRVSGALIP